MECQNDLLVLCVECHSVVHGKANPKPRQKAEPPRVMVARRRNGDVTPLTLWRRSCAAANPPDGQESNGSEAGKTNPTSWA
jgi:hypothetical protein